MQGGSRNPSQGSRRGHPCTIRSGRGRLGKRPPTPWFVRAWTGLQRLPSEQMLPSFSGQDWLAPDQLWQPWRGLHKASCKACIVTPFVIGDERGRPSLCFCLFLSCPCLSPSRCPCRPCLPNTLPWPFLAFSMYASGGFTRFPVTDVKRLKLCFFWSRNESSDDRTDFVKLVDLFASHLLLTLFNEELASHPRNLVFSFWGQSQGSGSAS